MEKIKLAESKAIKWALIILGELIFALLVFWLGMNVGVRQSNFMVRWGENYQRNFGDFRGGRPPFLPGGTPEPGYLINPHGAAGSVLKTDTSSKTIIIKGENNTEKTVLVTDKTTITKTHQSIKLSDIKTGDQIVVIGSPNNQGQIEAKFIRIFGN